VDPQIDHGDEKQVEPETYPAIVRARNIKRVEKRNRVLRLRRDGLTYDQISEALTKGTDGGPPDAITERGAASAVAQYVAELLSEDSETAEVLRQIDGERLERMFSRLEADLMRAGEDRAERRAIIHSQIRILERAAKLNGLDAPTKVEGKVEVNVRAVADPIHVRAVDASYSERFGVIELPVPEGARERD
jgi:hypothetical protein